LKMRNEALIKRIEVLLLAAGLTLRDGIKLIASVPTERIQGGE